MMTSVHSPLLNEQDAMRILGVSKRTMLTLRKEYALPYLRIGKQIRYRSDELADWCEHHRSKSNF